MTRIALPPLENWLASIVICLAVGYVAAQDSHRADQDEAAIAHQLDPAHSRDWAAEQACKGQPYEWADDTTLVCHTEQPGTVITAQAQSRVQP
jgi:hypothetical protein